MEEGEERGKGDREEREREEGVKIRNRVKPHCYIQIREFAIEQISAVIMHFLQQHITFLSWTFYSASKLV